MLSASEMKRSSNQAHDLMMKELLQKLEERAISEASRGLFEAYINLRSYEGNFHPKILQKVEETLKELGYEVSCEEDILTIKWSD